VGKRHRRIRARSATRQVAGAATEKPGLEAHRAKRPAQPAFSRRPLSQSTEPKPGPGRQRRLHRAVSCRETEHRNRKCARLCAGEPTRPLSKLQTMPCSAHARYRWTLRLRFRLGALTDTPDLGGGIGSTGWTALQIGMLSHGCPLDVPRTGREAVASVPLSVVTLAMVPRSAWANGSVNIGGSAGVGG
jgi:hypothetical protein